MLAKTKLDCIKGLICRPLIDSYIGHSNFLLIDELRKFDMKEGLNNFETSLTSYTYKQCYHIVWSVKKIWKVKTQGLWRQKTEAFIKNDSVW